MQDRLEGDLGGCIIGAEVDFKKCLYCVYFLELLL